MRTLPLALLALASIASADSPKPSAPGKGFWKVLVQPHAKWILDEDMPDQHSTLVIETYDVRKVAGADVARLRWTLIDEKGERTDVGDSGQGRYTQLAVTPAGLYILWDKQDDAKVAAMLKGKPSRSDPPKPYAGTKKNHGRYLNIQDGRVCIGEGPEPGAGDCPDTCDGTLCIDPVDGPVELLGNWAPGVSVFKKATPKK